MIFWVLCFVFVSQERDFANGTVADIVKDVAHKNKDDSCLTMMSLVLSSKCNVDPYSAKRITTLASRCYASEVLGKSLKPCEKLEESCYFGVPKSLTLWSHSITQDVCDDIATEFYSDFDGLPGGEVVNVIHKLSRKIPEHILSSIASAQGSCKLNTVYESSFSFVDLLTGRSIPGVSEQCVLDMLTIFWYASLCVLTLLCGMIKQLKCSASIKVLFAISWMALERTVCTFGFPSIKDTMLVLFRIMFLFLAPTVSYLVWKREEALRNRIKKWMNKGEVAR
jgi:hypothetical protein